ncbi:hypothetical protein A9W99_10645 [Mycobacterium sp. 1164966.3]|nr:hypothetical protein A9W99_10645 [Mycobacterium sp. 1164966.3]
MAAAAADAGQTPAAARDAAGSGVLAAGAAADAWDAALATRTAARTTVLAAGTAGAVGVAAAAAWVVLEDDMRRPRGRHPRSRRKNFGGGRWRRRDRCSDSPRHYQWFHEV